MDSRNINKSGKNIIGYMRWETLFINIFKYLPQYIYVFFLIYR